METLIADYLSKLEFGELQSFHNMGVIPLLTSVNGSPKYLTLKEALQKKLLKVKEIDEDGSVPELKVINKAKVSVLLLDGEELVGAKQNRVVNTTILLKKESETVIPVSCTEQGRWSYVSEEFADSGTVLSPRMRMVKAASVNVSLNASRRYESDQMAVWDEIEDLSERAQARSATGAMRHVYESRTKDLEKYLETFKYLPHQKGLCVVINGETVGFDILSLENAYQALHPKLVKSYAMDAILEDKEKSKISSSGKTRAFIEKARRSKEKKYKSVGQGTDHRFEGKAILGSALIYRKKVIHMAFFKTTESSKTGRMSSYSRRREFRV